MPPKRRTTRVSDMGKITTVGAERQLLETMRAEAACRLGPHATAVEVDALARRLYEGPKRADAGFESPMERYLRERDAEAAVREARAFGK